MMLWNLANNLIKSGDENCCLICDIEFKLSSRRYVCKYCSRNVCESCCRQHNTQSNQNNKNERICENCLPIIFNITSSKNNKPAVSSETELQLFLSFTSSYQYAEDNISKDISSKLVGATINILSGPNLVYTTSALSFHGDEIKISIDTSLPWYSYLIIEIVSVASVYKKTIDYTGRGKLVLQVDSLTSIPQPHTCIIHPLQSHNHKLYLIAMVRSQQQHSQDISTISGMNGHTHMNNNDNTYSRSSSSNETNKLSSLHHTLHSSTSHHNTQWNSHLSNHNSAECSKIFSVSNTHTVNMIQKLHLFFQNSLSDSFKRICTQPKYSSKIYLSALFKADCYIFKVLYPYTQMNLNTCTPKNGDLSRNIDNTMRQYDNKDISLICDNHVMNDLKSVDIHQIGHEIIHNGGVNQQIGDEIRQNGGENHNVFYDPLLSTQSHMSINTNNGSASVQTNTTILDSNPLSNHCNNNISKEIDNDRNDTYDISGHQYYDNNTNNTDSTNSIYMTQTISIPSNEQLLLILDNVYFAMNTDNTIANATIISFGILLYTSHRLIFISYDDLYRYSQYDICTSFIENDIKKDHHKDGNMNDNTNNINHKYVHEYEYIHTKHHTYHNNSHTVRHDLESQLLMNQSFPYSIYHQEISSIHVRTRWKTAEECAILEVVTGLDQLVYYFITDKYIPPPVTAFSTTASNTTTTSTTAHMTTSTTAHMTSMQNNRLSSTVYSPSSSSQFTNDMSTNGSTGLSIYTGESSTCTSAVKPMEIIRWIRDSIIWLKIEQEFHISSRYPLIIESNSSLGERNELPTATQSRMITQQNKILPRYQPGMTSFGYQKSCYITHTNNDMSIEYKRMGVLDYKNNNHSAIWRITDTNKTYRLCNSYPYILSIPSSISDEILYTAVKQRSSNRLPALTWIHPNGAPLCRSSQPLTGLNDKLCPEDETLLLAIRHTVVAYKSYIHKAYHTSLHGLSTTADTATQIPSSSSDKTITTTSTSTTTTTTTTTNMNGTIADNTRSASDPLNPSPADMTTNSEQDRMGITDKSMRTLSTSKSSSTLEIKNAYTIHPLSSSSTATSVYPSGPVSRAADTSHTSIKASSSTPLMSSISTTTSTPPSITTNINGSNVPYQHPLLTTNTIKLRILDCRPLISAQGNSIMGKGYENITRLGGRDKVTIQFANIQNIHTMRESYRTLRTQLLKMSSSCHTFSMNSILALGKSSNKDHLNPSTSTGTSLPTSPLYNTTMNSTSSSSSSNSSGVTQPTFQSPHHSGKLSTTASASANASNLSGTSDGPSSSSSSSSLLFPKDMYGRPLYSSPFLHLQTESINHTNNTNAKYMTPSPSSHYDNSQYLTWLNDACENYIPNTANASFIQAIHESKWLQYISDILQASTYVAIQLECNQPVLVHCSDGWDRTSQVCALAQILLDPYYRTIKGFYTLIIKDFLSFGHHFKTRYGTYLLASEYEETVQNSDLDIKKYKESSPVFLQFLDCVYQIWTQNITYFEFNESYLQFMALYYKNGYIYNFLFDTEAEKQYYLSKLSSGQYYSTCPNVSEMEFSTMSLSEIIQHNQHKFMNSFYNEKSLSTCTSTHHHHLSSDPAEDSKDFDPSADMGSTRTTQRIHINPLGSSLVLWTYHFIGLYFPISTCIYNNSPHTLSTPILSSKRENDRNLNVQKNYGTNFINDMIIHSNYIPVYDPLSQLSVQIEHKKYIQKQQHVIESLSNHIHQLQSKLHLSQTNLSKIMDSLNLSPSKLLTDDIINMTIQDDTWRTTPQDDQASSIDHGTLTNHIIVDDYIQVNK